MHLPRVSRTGTSNYIPQILWDVITCPFPWCLLVVPHFSFYVMAPTCNVAWIRLMSDMCAPTGDEGRKGPARQCPGTAVEARTLTWLRGGAASLSIGVGEQPFIGERPTDAGLAPLTSSIFDVQEQEAYGVHCTSIFLWISCSTLGVNWNQSNLVWDRL